MILFWIKEAFKLIARAKFSFLLTLISITLSVILITVSVFIIRVSDNLEKRIKGNITVSVFIKESLNEKKIELITEVLRSEKFINSVGYINKEKAADMFIKETGEDFRKILDYNPLPASFSIKLKDEYANSDSIKKIIKDLSSREWVSEVVFRQDFIQKFLGYIDQAKFYVFIITGLIFLVSLYLVYSTVKLILSSKYSELESMKLVGAKLSTIKMPIILNSAITGFTASLLALGIIGIAYSYLKNFLFNIDTLFSQWNELLVILLLVGPIIGIAVTFLSLRKISLKI